MEHNKQLKLRHWRRSSFAYSGYRGYNYQIHRALQYSDLETCLVWPCHVGMVLTNNYKYTRSVGWLLSTNYNGPDQDGNTLNPWVKEGVWWCYRFTKYTRQSRITSHHINLTLRTGVRETATQSTSEWRNACDGVKSMIQCLPRHLCSRTRYAKVFDQSITHVSIVMPLSFFRLSLQD